MSGVRIDLFDLLVAELDGERCPQCNGKGKVAFGDKKTLTYEIENCDECEGSGYVPKGRYDR